MATATKKSRWFRHGTRKPDLPEFGRVFDLYWGGPERRITGLTLRITAVNVIALLILVTGILYLSQYQKNIIEAKLETFKAEVELVAAAISEGAIERDERGAISLDNEEATRMAARTSKTTGQRTRLFDSTGKLFADAPGRPYLPRVRGTGTSIEILKSMTGFIIGLVPNQRSLPIYPQITSENAADYEDAANAMQGQISISAWHNESEKVFLSAAAPIFDAPGEIVGAVMLTREAPDIEETLAGVWIEVLKIFAVTFVITIMLSIYLSGVIAKPLRRLARAAEGVRSGQSKDTEIPDLSHRKDEIGELSIVLRDMMEALWERMDSIESFAADVAHELKNPLTSLRSAVETASVIEKKTDRDKLFGIIKHDVDRLDRLISDISHASRLEAELSREDFNRVNLSDALKQMIDIYKNPLERDAKKGGAKARFRGVDIRLEEAENAYVWGIEERLMQVFQNLISNAVSFSPEGGKVTVRLSPVGGRVFVTVEDEGPGIPENKLETIFERFYSERPQHEDYGQHSGLGLSICRQIVEAHNGRIFAENVHYNGKPSGAKFTVILDAA